MENRYTTAPCLYALIVPTRSKGMQPWTLRVHCDAERHGRRYHAERGNDQVTDPPLSRAGSLPQGLAPIRGFYSTQLLPKAQQR